MKLVTVTSRETGLKVGLGTYSIHEVHEEPSKEGEPLSGCTLFVTRPEDAKLTLVELPVQESFDSVTRLIEKASDSWTAPAHPVTPAKKKKTSKKKAAAPKKKATKKVVKKATKKVVKQAAEKKK